MEIKKLKGKVGGKGGKAMTEDAKSEKGSQLSGDPLKENVSEAGDNASLGFNEDEDVKRRLEESLAQMHSQLKEKNE